MKPYHVQINSDYSVFSTLELYKEFQEEAYSIALHPSGLYVLVGFSDKLRLMNLLIDDIRCFKEFTIRGCREVRKIFIRKSHQRPKLYYFCKNFRKYDNRGTLEIRTKNYYTNYYDVKKCMWSRKKTWSGTIFQWTGEPYGLPDHWGKGVSFALLLISFGW